MIQQFLKNILPAILLLTFVSGLAVDISAQADKLSLDKKAIRAMAGCYDVEFKYTETFAPEVDYEMAYDYTSAAFEWAEVIEETDEKIVLQHLLIIQKDSMPPYIIKHWRQDWIYQETERYRFDKDSKWVYEQLSPEEAEGTWTQNVYQVDDSPRYTGTATWTHVDGVSSWYNKADSPLPRREYSKRSDYNVMKRGNRIQITDYGWLHEQDNDKIIRTDSSEVLLVQEKGYNTYKKRAASDCKAAQDYWNQNTEMWTDVRSVWDEVLDNKKDLQLHEKLEGKRLYEHLFFGGEWDREAITDIVNKYIVNSTDQTGASAN